MILKLTPRIARGLSWRRVLQRPRQALRINAAIFLSLLGHLSDEVKLVEHRTLVLLRSEFGDDSAEPGCGGALFSPEGLKRDKLVALRQARVGEHLSVGERKLAASHKGLDGLHESAELQPASHAASGDSRLLGYFLIGEPEDSDTHFIRSGFVHWIQVNAGSVLREHQRRRVFVAGIEDERRNFCPL